MLSCSLLSGLPTRNNRWRTEPRKWSRFRPKRSFIVAMKTIEGLLVEHSKGLAVES